MFWSTIGLFVDCESDPLKPGMSSDEEYDSSSANNWHNDRRDQQMSSLTSFLFGNIDSEGNLVDDFLDDDSKRHLSSLQRHLSDVIRLNDIVDDDDDESGLEDNDEKDDKDRHSDSNTNSQSSDDNRVNGNQTNGHSMRHRSNSFDSSYGSQNQNGSKSEDCMNTFRFVIVLNVSIVLICPLIVI